MTEREFYQYLLIECNKVEAPTLLLEDYVYIANKSVQQYINEVINRYDINQQSTDDLSALKTTAQLKISTDSSGIVLPSESKMYVCALPPDYLHLLNCIVKFDDTKSDKTNKNNCKSESDEEDDGSVCSPARRLESDKYPSITTNAYLKPSYKRPYYFITNVVKEEVTDDEFQTFNEIGKLINGDVPQNYYNKGGKY